MQCYSTIADLRAALAKVRENKQRIGFVPTMGNLHEGHLKLVQVAQSQTDYVLVSNFVNPTQFVAGEDFDRYPRTLQADNEKLAAIGCDAVFAPSVAEVYPQPATVQIRLPALAETLCGRSRPGHFDGVGLVVSKLFNIVQPELAFLGLKDYQQCLLIRHLVQDLNFPIGIVLVETVREADGLAKSSRNQYLTAGERTIAPQLYANLLRIKQALLLGERDYPTLELHASERLAAAGFEVDYVQIRNPDTLLPSAVDEQHWQVLAAARLGGARLIDNLAVNLLRAANIQG